MAGKKEVAVWEAFPWLKEKIKTGSPITPYDILNSAQPADYMKQWKFLILIWSSDKNPDIIEYATMVTKALNRTKENIEKKDIRPAADLLRSSLLVDENYMELIRKNIQKSEEPRIKGEAVAPELIASHYGQQKR